MNEAEANRLNQKLNDLRSFLASNNLQVLDTHKWGRTTPANVMVQFAEKFYIQINHWGFTIVEEQGPNVLSYPVASDLNVLRQKLRDFAPVWVRDRIDSALDEVTEGPKFQLDDVLDVLHSQGIPAEIVSAPENAGYPEGTEVVVTEADDLFVVLVEGGNEIAIVENVDGNEHEELDRFSKLANFLDNLPPEFVETASIEHAETVRPVAQPVGECTGAANLHINLSGGAITITNGGGTKLAQKIATEAGDWDKLIDFLKRDLGAEWLVS